MQVSLNASVRIYSWFGGSQDVRIEKWWDIEEIEGLPASRYLLVGYSSEVKDKKKIDIGLLFAQPNPQRLEAYNSVLVDYQTVSITLDGFRGRKVSLEKISVQLYPSHKEMAEIGRRIEAMGFFENNTSA